MPSTQANTFKPSRPVDKAQLDGSGFSARSILWMVLVLLVWVRPALAVPAGTLISNTAQVTYTFSGQSGLSAFSNTIEHTAVTLRTDSSTSLLQYNIDTADQSQAPPPGSVSLVDLMPVSFFKNGECIFVRVDDADQNLDATQMETVLVTLTVTTTGDREQLQITETGPDTGTFLGYLTTTDSTDLSAVNNGTLTVIEACRIQCDYVDSADPNDQSSDTALVDPFGIVFDSTTGDPIDEVLITLIDAATELPATVFGDDGVSSFPSTIASGATVSDSGGQTYVMPQGSYRFPIVAPGTYRLDVQPPDDYAAPSTVPTSELQNLPSAPFVIAEPGSRGEPFVLNPGPSFRADIPIDPQTNIFWITKQANRDQVSAGDFVQYTLEIENLSPGTVSNITVSDLMPNGFRYQSESVRIDDTTILEPAISSDGRQLSFSLADMASGARTTIRYVAAVGAGAPTGRAVNSAVVQRAGSVSSNAARVAVQVTDAFFRSNCFIVGRVAVQNATDPSDTDNNGVQGVRIYLEDGTYVVTDAEGRYHFEGVAPGAHVVQLDLESLPRHYEILSVESNTRMAGRSFSQFVDLAPGTLWRTDFFVGLKPPNKGHAQIRLNAAVKDGTIVYTANLEGADVPLRNRRLAVMLPAGTAYMPGSSHRDGVDISDPRVTGDVLTYDLGNAQGPWQTEVTFSATPSDRPSAELITKAVLSFDTPATKRQQTPVVENKVHYKVEERRLRQDAVNFQLQPDALLVDGMDNLLIKVTEESVIKHPPIVLNPRFDVFSAELKTSDKAKIDQLAERLENLEIQQIVVTGHSDAAPIKPNKQHFYADNRALSLARAQSVARHLTQILDIEPAKIRILGKGSDEPVASNDSASGRALNRRVSVQIKSKELLRQSSMQQIAPTSKLSTLPENLSDKEKVLLDELTQQLKDLEIIHIEVAYLLNHTTQIGLDHQNQDVSALPMARAQAISNYLVRSLGLTGSQFSLIGKSPAERRNEALSPDELIWDYRIDIRVHTQEIKRYTHMQVVKAQDQARIVTTGLQPGQVWKDASDVSTRPETSAPSYDKSWLETALPGLQWLLPAPGTIPAVPSTKIAVKHPADGEPVLILNGRPVSPINFDGIELDSTKTKAISRWTGVDLIEGDNQFEILFKDKQKGVVQRIIHKIHYPGPPMEAELVAQKSRLIADGKQSVVVAVRLKDKSGHPVRPGVTGEFTVQPPYSALQTETQRNLQPLTMAGPPKAQYIVAENGIALIPLQPTVQSGEVVLNLHLVGGTHELRCWLQPELRDWILVGLAQGTAGYNTLSGNMENLDSADLEEDLYQDGRIALFAKGRIKGSWLLTLAYDSAKDPKDEGSRLFQTIDPDTYYTLYGDDTEQGYEAASLRKLYLKIERNQFYALFGDYETGLTVTELSRYNRRLNGLKTELQRRHVNINAFASETDQAFAKDEIRGDGTSGLYHLSRARVAINSESVRLEIRDRFQSELIISSQSLTRHIDYSIDYDSGTLFFKFPVYSQDENLNPQYIVIDYETDSASEQAYTYGGRAAVKMLSRKIEVGTSYIHEGPANGEADLAGVDATVSLPAGLEFNAEMAASQNNTVGTETDGQAYLAELTQSTENFNAKAYIRQQEEDFGLGQQNGSEAATRKYGLDMSYRLSEHWRINGQALRQHNLATTAQRDLDEAALVYTQDNYSLRSGLRLNEDRLGDGTKQRSELLTAGGSLTCLDQHLQLRLDHEHAIDDETAGVDFPSRTILGADYQISDAVALYGTQEFLWHTRGTEQNTRLGVKTTPWQGGQIGTDVQQSSSENGRRLSANLGLFQTWQLTDRWRLDGGLDRSQTIDQSDKGSFNPSGTSGSGATEAFTALSLGVGFDADKWSWSSRVETRYADTQEKRQVFTGAVGELRKGLGLSAGLTLAQTSDEPTGDSTNGDVRLSMALRPSGSAWTLLNRLEYIFDMADQNASENRRLVNNLNANCKPHDKLQVGLQYGAKYVLDTFDDQEYAGFVDLIGLETRYDLTNKWDVGVRGSVLHTWQTGQMEYSTGLSVGHTLFENTGISAGYNFLGFEDADFSCANYTAQGPFVQFRMKFDQQTVREILEKWQK
jgi:uncharacterized repeat protein (TIGR01451 family)